MAKHWLYLDESGDFEEGSALSLVGGMLSAKPISEGTAWSTLQQLAGHKRDTRFHATAGSPSEKESWAQALPDVCRANGWQPVVFEHSTRVEVVDNATTYLMVLAEGAAQLVADLVSAGGNDSPLDMTFCVAGRTATVRGSSDREFIEGNRLVEHMRERIGIEQTRAFPSLRRRVSSGVELGDARTDPRLMLADLVCHLWLKRSVLSKAARQSLEALVGAFRYATLVSDAKSRLRQAIQSGRLGAAITDAVELWQRDRQALEQLNKYLIDRLAGLSNESLSRQLEATLARVEARAAIHRVATAGRAERGIAQEVDGWRAAILDPLRARLPPAGQNTVRWAEVRLNWSLLTALNHAGALTDAARVVADLIATLTELPLDIPHLALGLEIQFAQAVHDTDTCAYQSAGERMDKLADNLDSIMGLLAAIWPGSAVEARSRLLGKALGCSLQAWHKHARRHPAAYDVARERSDKALALFTSADDLRRQRGYRALLEADAGDLPAAWMHLRRALEADEEASPSALLDACGQDPWSVMYWAHLMYASARIEPKGAAELLAAWNRINPGEGDWLGEAFRFPGHLISWKVGAVAAMTGQPKQAKRLLDQAVQHCFADAGCQALRFVGLGVLADYVGHAPRNQAKGLLQKLTREVDQLRRKAPDPMAVYLQAWQGPLEELDKRDATHLGEARALAWDVCY